MNIEADKIELAKLVLETTDPEIIQSIRDVFNNNSSKDFWDDLTQAQRDEIEKASTEIDEGKAIDYESFIAKHR